ncbi:unnamed protein product [Peniophora sp. CBMAI 1063]|nr:unnamed protein product [Peniophora sp. CBMAI 1063]
MPDAATVDLPNLQLTDARSFLLPYFTPANNRRVRSINIGLAANGAPDELEGLLAGNFPKLHTLSLLCWEPEHYGLALSNPKDIIWVEALEISRAPALTRVDLRNCLPPWNANIYSQLTHLEIRIRGRNVLVSEQQRPTHEALLSVITSMDAIEEIYLDVFPNYPNAGAEPEPVHVPSRCKLITLHTSDPNLNRHCCRLGASFVLPPKVVFIIRQASGKDAELAVRHFAGPSRPPSALSFNSGGDYRVDGTLCGQVTIPLNPARWLKKPEALAERTPRGFVSIQFELYDVPDDIKEEYDDYCRYTMLESLCQVDFSEVKVLRIENIWEDRDILRLFGVDESEGDVFDEKLLEPPILADATEVEVVVLTMEGYLPILADLLHAGRHPFPKFHTIHAPEM